MAASVSDVSWILSRESNTRIGPHAGWRDWQGSRQARWDVSAGPFTGRLVLHYRIPIAARNTPHLSLALDQIAILRLDVNDNHKRWRLMTHAHRRAAATVLEPEVAFLPDWPPAVPLVGHVSAATYRNVLEAFANECNIVVAADAWSDPWPGEEVQS